MEEIVWIRSADFDPAITAGRLIRPDPSLPAFRVLARQTVVMMFLNGGDWQVRPFTQLTLAIAEGSQVFQEQGAGEGFQLRERVTPKP